MLLCFAAVSASLSCYVLIDSAATERCNSLVQALNYSRLLRCATDFVDANKIAFVYNIVVEYYVCYC